MLLPADSVLQSLTQEIARLPIDAEWQEGSVNQSIVAALKLLAAREQGGSKLLHAQVEALAVCIHAIVSAAPTGASKSALASVQSALLAARTCEGLQQQERAWVQLLQRVEALAAALSKDQSIDTAIRSRLLINLARWESVDLQKQLDQDDRGPDEGSIDFEITLERFTDYLRDRFSDDGLTVTEFPCHSRWIRQADLPFRCHQPEPVGFLRSAPGHGGAVA